MSKVGNSLELPSHSAVCQHVIGSDGVQLAEQVEIFKELIEQVRKIFTSVLS